ncbi:ribosomal protein S6 kinase beta-like [Zootermopsis nevadensis]|uniref:Putative ribosomal protein S6 kinase alpha-1 n=1 Tax=Zootermopsis nevadensis TaxID=136037 RepID=A0A067REJ7_ZOONE|nr:ribosomal protein S6 kinase beta-like [Zootermopsis nevadensis]KDR21468.1 Putative ribosomal protein S6 kinase alpha-1 [Zootermopsis nevadensis]
MKEVLVRRFMKSPTSFSTFGFGKVYMTQKNCGMDNNTVYAMKIMDVPIEGDRDKYQRECYVHQLCCQFPFLVALCYTFQTKSKICLALDYYPGGDLYHLLRYWGKFTETAARLYLAEIGLAVEYLHQIGVIQKIY